MAASPCTILVVASTIRVPTLQRTLTPGVHVFAGDVRGRLRHGVCRPPAVCVFYGVTEGDARTQARTALAAAMRPLEEKLAAASDSLRRATTEEERITSYLAEVQKGIAELEKDGVTQEEQLEHRRLLAETQQFERLLHNVRVEVATYTQLSGRAELEVTQARRRMVELLNETAGDDLPSDEVHVTDSATEPFTDTTPVVLEEDEDGAEESNNPSTDSVDAPHPLEDEHDALEPSGAQPVLAPKPVASVVVDPDARDDLTQLDGIGAGRQRILNEHGIRNYAQVANMTPEQLDEMIVGIGADKAQAIIEEARLLSL